MAWVCVIARWPLAEPAKQMATLWLYVKSFLLHRSLSPFLYHNTIEQFIILTGQAHAVLSKTST